MLNKVALKRAITTHKVIAVFTRDELEFMDRLGKDALFSTGHKLSYIQIIKGLVNYAMEAGINGNNIDSAEALKEKLDKRFPEILEDRGGGTT